MRSKCLEGIKAKSRNSPLIYQRSKISYKEVKEMEDSGAWAWALQQNIMDLNFKTYPTEEPVNDTLSTKDNDDEKQMPRRHQS